MTPPNYDQNFWENLWSKTLREHAQTIARRPPNAHFTSDAAKLRPGRALDAGCGHGAETLWLAAHGWQVTAVDFSAQALDHGRSMAQNLGPEVANRIHWTRADLAQLPIEPDHFDLVLCLYVHVAGSLQTMVQKLASGVAVGGSLWMVGYQPSDPSTENVTVPGQQQIDIQSTTAALDPTQWEFITARERPRPDNNLDAIIHARRLF